MSLWFSESHTSAPKRGKRAATLFGVAILAVGSLFGVACSTEHNLDLAQRESAIIPGAYGDGEYYLRCNATGWQLDAATHFAPTSEAGKFVLEYDVTQSWMLSGDQCQLTETNSADGWGTNAQYWYSTRTQIAPITVALSRSTTPAPLVLSYPQLGHYHALLDMNAGTVSIAAGAYVPADGQCAVQKCLAGETFNQAVCQCVPDSICVAETCAAGQVFDATACDCVDYEATGPCSVKKCLPGEVQDMASCACVPAPEECLVVKCRVGEVQNMETCLCEPKPEECLVAKCRVGEAQNMETCLCEPKPAECLVAKCRVGEAQNMETCLCEPVGDDACMAVKCPIGQHQDPETCGCVTTPTVCAARKCYPDEHQDPVSCECVVDSCLVRKCRIDEHQDPVSCECVPDCMVRKCRIDEHQDPVSCECVPD